MKTSTGFSTGGATIEDIELMREAVGPTMGVKASGGARTNFDRTIFKQFSCRFDPSWINTDAGKLILLSLIN